MYKVDGVLRTAKAEDIVPGTVLRLVNNDGTSSAWSDCTITKIEYIGQDNKFYDQVCLIRPYIVQNAIGECGIYTENFKVPFHRLLDNDYCLMVVTMSTGKPATTLR